MSLGSELWILTSSGYMLWLQRIHYMTLKVIARVGGTSNVCGLWIWPGGRFECARHLGSTLSRNIAWRPSSIGTIVSSGYYREEVMVSVLTHVPMVLLQQGQPISNAIVAGPLLLHKGCNSTKLRSMLNSHWSISMSQELLAMSADVSFGRPSVCNNTLHTFQELWYSKSLLCGTC